MYYPISHRSVWEEIPELGIKVDITKGHIVNIKTGKHISVYRDQHLGTIIGHLPKNEGKEGFGKGKFVQAARIILTAVNGGSPFKNPRHGFAAPINGNKWDLNPENLVWMSRKEFKQRQVMENTHGLKLNGNLVLTIKDVVSKLADEGIKDIDAIGYSFGISATMVNYITTKRSWGYVDTYIELASSKMANYYIPKVKQAVHLFADRDQELIRFVSNYYESNVV